MRLSKLSPVLILTFAACGSVNSLPDDPVTLDEAVASTYGGVTESDEAPAFDDEVLADRYVSAEDPAASDDSLSSRPELEGARHVRVLVAWGYLRPHWDATEWIDWTGNITAANAALRVARVVRFEPETDHLLPRSDLHVVPFASQTKPHWDGLLLDVVIAPALNPDGGPVTLTFQGGPANYTLTIEPGMRTNVVVDVDEVGHQLAFHVIRPDADGCAEGFLLGRWARRAEVDGRVLGHFHGRFLSSDGAVRGLLRGVFGRREDGTQVFFGKIIDRSGAFIGVLAGRWGEGRFDGRFLVHGRQISGVLHGRIFDADDDGDGAFAGRWSQRCSEDLSEGGTMPTDDTPPPEGD